MATSNTALQVAELDYFKIRDNLKNFLRSQDQFTDYDFEGSGMAVLLDVLAYNTYYNSYYLNMIANESFLDTAQIRNNILSHAKLINYVPTSSQGALSEVNVVVIPSLAEDQSTNSLILDKYTRIIGQDVDGVNYTFVTLNSNTAVKVSGSFTFPNVFIKQGEVITQQFLVDANNTYRKFEIPSANMDTTTLSVTVQASSSNTVTEEYFEVKDITGIDANTRGYFVEENENLNYSIYFGDDVLGKKPDIGNIVIVTYLDNVGSVSNNISKFTFVEPIGGKFKDNVTISTVTGSYGGIDKEDINSIRFRAPNFYTTQNRCVTIGDYETILLKDYNNIDAVSVWGGEENDPVVYGKVFMSLKTKGFYRLTELEKQNIKESLIQSRNVLTVTPEIVDPDYNFVMVRGKIYYNPSLTSKNSNELLSIIQNSIEQYNQDELNTFKSVFKQSLFQQYIEKCEPSIVSSDIDIILQKRLDLLINESRNYTINYNTPLRKGDFGNRLYTYPEVIVNDPSGTLRRILFEEVPDSYTGVDRIDIVNSGINYNAPTVTISGDGTGAIAVAKVVNGRIVSIDVTSKGINYTRATVTITDLDGSQATAIAVLQGRIGTLRTYYYKTNGEKVIVNSQAGTIDYLTGKIVLTSFNPLNVPTNQIYDADVLTVNAAPENQVIYPLRNRILVIDTDNIQTVQLELIPVT